MGRLENLVAAQALALTDRIATAGEARLVVAAGERAALVTLLAHPDQPVSWLGEVLGLTSSGITRLVDRLAAAGSVTRSPAADGRSRTVRLTASGRRRAQQLLRAREQAMADALAGLSARDRRELERILDVLVADLADDRPSALQVCRLCDRTACATAGTCPLQHTVDPA